MKRLPERYYDLVLERDQLKEDIDDILSKDKIDVMGYLERKIQMNEIEEELFMIEQELKDEEKQVIYIIEREVYDIENEDFYNFYEEYGTVAEALIEFTIQINDLKELFAEYEDICETDEHFYIKDSEEIVTLTLYKVNVD